MRHALWTAIGLAVVSLSACGSDGDDTSSAASSSASTSGAGGAATGAGEGGAATSSSATGGGDGGAGGGGSCGPLADACTRCMSQSCEDRYCTCYGNAECSALISCLDACDEGDADCGQACLSDHEGGISDALLLGDCGATSCATDCPGSTELSACESCLFTSCSTQMNDCFADAECSALVLCINECAPGNTTCQQRCAVQHGGGVSKARAVQMCAESSCSADCN